MLTRIRSLPPANADGGACHNSSGLPTASATLWHKLSGNVIRYLPQGVRFSSRHNPGNQGCVGGTKCQFFLVCWMGGGSLGSSCGPLYTCCVTPSSQEIQPAFYGPVSNDPYCGRSSTRISRIVGGSDASFGQFPWQVSPAVTAGWRERERESRRLI